FRLKGYALLRTSRGGANPRGAESPVERTSDVNMGQSADRVGVTSNLTYRRPRRRRSIFIWRQPSVGEFGLGFRVTVLDRTSAPRPGAWGWRRRRSSPASTSR